MGRHRLAHARSAVAPFLLATTAISAAFWFAGAEVKGEWLVSGLPASAAMFIAPALAVLVTRRQLPEVRAEGRSAHGPGAAGARYLSWSLLMPGLLALCWGLAVLSGADLPGPVTSARQVALLCLVFTASSACEEFGWTRFLTLSLLPRMSIVAVGVGVGAIWAALHVIPYLQGGRSWAWVVWQCAFTVAFRVLIVAAVVLTGHWGVAIALHASYDVAWALYPTGGSHYDPALLAPLTAVVAALLVRRCARMRAARVPALTRTVPGPAG